MKRLISTVFLFGILAIAGFGQAAKTAQLSEQQWNDLYTALEAENWDTAAKLSADYLKQTTAEVEAVRLRYMYLYSAAGRVSAGKMNFDELENQIKAFVGKDVSIPYQYISDSCERGPNFNTICRGDNPTRLMITASNKAATTIHAFIYIQLKEKFDFAKNDGKIGSVRGHIDSIAPNPNKSRFLVMRIYISAAEIKVEDK